MTSSPDTDTTFFRIGEMPGWRRQMLPAPWPKDAIPLSDRMSPCRREFYSDRGGNFRCGIWECNAGSIELCDCTADQVCFILRGTLRLTDRQDRSEVFGTGECIVIPRGFTGVWSQSGDFAMTYVLIGEKASN